MCLIASRGENHRKRLFQTLKSQFCKATVDALSIVDFKKIFTLHVDTSDYTVSAVLTQVADDGTQRPVAFASNKLKKPKRTGL